MQPNGGGTYHWFTWVSLEAAMAPIKQELKDLPGSQAISTPAYPRVKKCRLVGWSSLPHMHISSIYDYLCAYQYTYIYIHINTCVCRIYIYIHRIYIYEWSKTSFIADNFCRPPWYPKMGWPKPPEKIPSICWDVSPLLIRRFNIWLSEIPIFDC